MERPRPEQKRLPFTKMHGIGNDFVVVDARGEPERDWAALAVAVCDRHFGVGSDGLILILNSSAADLRMRMLNPDGSEAEMCGNGIRCFARYALEEGLAGDAARELSVETLAGIQRVRPELRDGQVAAVRVEMGPPRLAAREIPVALPGAAADAPVRDYPLEAAGRRLAITAVSMGNPHAVAFLDEPVDAYPLAEVGPAVERHGAFPRRTNFEIANVQSRSRIVARVWERGAGLTLACGTGACAVGVAAMLHGRVDSPVEVVLPGGSLVIEWDGRGPVYMTGAAERVFQGEF